jgi:hypothetical protein
MMKNILFGITILAVLTHMDPAFAKAQEVTVTRAAQPISALIDNWGQFRAGIIAKTRQYNRYNHIKPGQLATLPQALVGKWNMVNRRDHSGYRLRAVLDLNKRHHFRYTYQVKAGGTLQHWAFSGRWDVKNQILMLLIDKSNYPGEASHDVLFWRLLQIGHSKLVYVRSGADQLQAMTRQDGTRGS